MAEPIRIFVADDHPIVREGLIAILGTQPDFRVVGEAGDGNQAVTMLSSLAADVLLVDLEMPGLDGVGVIRHLHQSGAAVRCLAFTVFDSEDRILAALKAGALGYLLKGAPREEIFRAIRVVASGGSLLASPLAVRALRQALEPGGGETEGLSPRELEVLELIALGRTNRDIATALFISERTVKFHVSALLTRLGASNRTEAVAMATQRGLLRH